MCVVSMIGDHYSDKYKQDQYQDLLDRLRGNSVYNNTQFPILPLVSKKEFDALKKEVEEMKQLLKKAIAYDEKNNEPHCEIEDKVKLLKEVAKLLGVDLSEIFK